MPSVSPFDDFSFIDETIILTQPMLEFNPSTVYKLDVIKVKRLLNNSKHFPLWLDINEIMANNEHHLFQLDLLGHSSSPALFIQSEKESLLYLVILKPYTNAQDIFYGDNQKKLIELCLKERLSNFVNQVVVNELTSENYIQVCKNQIDKINYLNNELSNSKQELNSLYLNLAKHILKDLIDKNETVSLSDNAIEFLKQSEFNYESLEIQLKDAYKIAKSLSSTLTHTRISKDFLQIKGPNKLITPSPSSSNEQIMVSKAVSKVNAPEKKSPSLMNSRDKLEKTILLLDRYETAVLELIKNKLPVMGKNIADACDPKISAPALTDSIQKHRERIIQCLKLYPERWLNLKTNYPPIQKLINQL